jgi:hypothetical protein
VVVTVSAKRPLHSGYWNVAVLRIRHPEAIYMSEKSAHQLSAVRKLP